MDMLDHPAVAVAVGALTDHGLTPVTAVVRDDVVVVVVDGEAGRWIVLAQHVEDSWRVGPGTIFGTTRPDTARDVRTPEYLPLQRLGTRFRAVSDTEGWFAVTGLAADDATSVTVTSSLEEHTSPVTADGVALTVVRATSTEQPRIYVHTTDGRKIAA